MVKDLGKNLYDFYACVGFPTFWNYGIIHIPNES